MNKENRYCLKRQAYCKFANRCIYCTHYAGDRLCSLQMENGKANDLTRCHGKNQKCFNCDNIFLLEEHNAIDYCNEAIKYTR